MKPRLPYHLDPKVPLQVKFGVFRGYFEGRFSSGKQIYQVRRLKMKKLMIIAALVVLAACATQKPIVVNNSTEPGWDFDNNDDYLDAACMGYWLNGAHGPAPEGCIK